MSGTVKFQIQPDHPAIFKVDDGQEDLNDPRTARDPSKEASHRVRVGRPFYSDNLRSFTWATTVANRTDIGTYMDSYPPKTLAIDARFYAIAECQSSSFWTMIEFK